MNRDSFLDAQFQLSFQAGMNQRYHQKQADLWWQRDAIAKAATAILAVIGAMVASAALYPNHSPYIDYGGLLASVLAAISAVILNVIPFGAWEKDHRIFFKQWTEIRKEADYLLFDCPTGDPSPTFIDELKKLNGRAHLLCGDEPAPDEKVLMTCFKEEEKSRTPPKMATA